MNQSLGRRYFLLQGLAGAAWWVMVSVSVPVREATLGTINPIVMASFDIPLFVLASLCAALVGNRWRGVTQVAASIATFWTVLVAIGMVLYAAATGLAGWGAVLMFFAAVGSVGAWCLVILHRIPMEWVLVGPLRFREARGGSRGTWLLQTFAQMLVFWVILLGLLPWLIAWCEQRWGLTIAVPSWVGIAGVVLFVSGSALGVWSAVSMARHGKGTPLPARMARRLVIVGPYRLVRNPMAVAGVMQGLGVGLMWGSWLVLAYALVGSCIWNWLVRPLEERDLEQRFGQQFLAYRDQVRVWLPRIW